MGNICTDRALAWLDERVVETGSLVLRTVGGDRGGVVALDRLLGRPDVDPAIILVPAIERTTRACAGLDIVVAQDTTEINFAGRAARRSGLGPAGDGESPGFFIHPQIAIDAASGSVLGVVGAELWTRPATKASAPRGRPAGEKESRRWYTGVCVAAERLGPVAARITGVSDRESDIYSLFAKRPTSVDLIVRSAQNRSLDGGGSLNAAADAWPVLAIEKVEVPARRIGVKGGPSPARTARVEVRAGTIRLLRPKGRRANAGDAAAVEVDLVVVREVGAPAGATPLAWRLLSTRAARDAAAALEVVRRYRLRWRIEEVFRTLKTDGLDLEASQVTTAQRLINLATVGLVAATRIVQLVDARDGSTRPATDVIDERDIEAVAAIGATLEGATPRQRNRWPEGSLAWLAWIAGRLGGWNCYGRPPGPKTMAAGWRRLAQRIEGFHLAAPTPTKNTALLRPGTCEAKL